MGARAAAPLAPAALAALAALTAACAHLPPLIRAEDPLSAQEHAQLGIAYESQGLMEQAARQYAASTRLDPANAEAWVALGDLAYDGKDLRRAERCYRRALSAVPHHPGASNNLAMVYMTQDRKLAEAERLVVDALEQGGPLKPYVLDTLANVYLRQGRYGEAHAALHEAESSGPDDAAFRRKLSETRAKLEAAGAAPR